MWDALVARALGRLGDRLEDGLEGSAPRIRGIWSAPWPAAPRHALPRSSTRPPLRPSPPSLARGSRHAARRHSEAPLPTTPRACPPLPGSLPRLPVACEPARPARGATSSESPEQRPAAAVPPRLLHRKLGEGGRGPAALCKPSRRRHRRPGREPPRRGELRVFGGSSAVHPPPRKSGKQKAAAARREIAGRASPQTPGHAAVTGDETTNALLATAPHQQIARAPSSWFPGHAKRACKL